MQFTDSHIHLQDYKANNTQQIIAKLKQCNFAKVICVSAKAEDFAAVASFVETLPQLIIPSFGIHPWYIDNPDYQLQELRRYLTLYPQSIIGECGLDRSRGADIQQQTVIFNAHLELATELKRPLNIHLTKADDIFAQSIKKFSGKFMIHSFGGSLQFLESIINKGGFISLNPSLLKRPSSLDIIRHIPLDHLLTESDFPFQSNFEDVPCLINHIAAIKNIPPSQLAEQITNNFNEFIKKNY